MSIGAMLFKAIGDVVKMRRQQGQPDDPNTFDIMISKTGTGMKTKYSAQFTGDTSPLSEDEEAYELWPVHSIAKLTPHSERDAIAKYLVGEGPAPDNRKSSGKQDTYSSDDDDAPSPAYGAARGPVQMQRSTPPTAAPAPAKPPQAAPKPAVAPAAAKAAAPAKLAVKPAQQEYQDTVPTDDADPSTYMLVPCTDCGSDMQINMEDNRDLKCHSCGKVFLHPSKS